MTLATLATTFPPIAVLTKQIQWIQGNLRWLGGNLLNPIARKDLCYPTLCRMPQTQNINFRRFPTFLITVYAFLMLLILTQVDEDLHDFLCQVTLRT